MLRRVSYAPIPGFPHQANGSQFLLHRSLYSSLSNITTPTTGLRLHQRVWLVSSVLLLLDWSGQHGYILPILNQRLKLRSEWYDETTYRLEEY